MGLNFSRMAGKISSAKRKPTVVVIAGTTAVGKTELSLELCRRLNGEVVSADSVQVYRHMDIGSAKIDPASCAHVPHHLLNVVDVTQPFNAGEYYKLAVNAIESILSRGHVPLVVGGTGFYVRTLLQGPTGAPPSTVESMERIEDMVREDNQDWDKSLQRLSKMDADYAASLERNDWYRLKRALDICTLSGRTVTSFKKKTNEDTSPFQFRCLFLTMCRILLFQRIDSRCEVIVDQGLFPEVISLVHNHGLVPDCPAGRSVGYRQALEWLQDTWGFPETNRTEPYTLKMPREEVNKSFLSFLFTYKARTRTLAAQQLAWHKKEEQFQWVNMAPGDGGQRLPMEEVAERIVQWLQNGTSLPPEWDGTSLMTLSKQETEYLRQYTASHSKPEIYSDPAKITSLITDIETALQSTLRQ